MRLIFVITSLIVLTAVLPVFASAPNPIEPLLENNRVLLVFAPARTDQNYLEIKNDLVAFLQALSGVVSSEVRLDLYDLLLVT